MQLRVSPSELIGVCYGNCLPTSKRVKILPIQPMQPCWSKHSSQLCWPSHSSQPQLSSHCCWSNSPTPLYLTSHTGPDSAIYPVSHHGLNSSSMSSSSRPAISHNKPGTNPSSSLLCYPRPSLLCPELHHILDCDKGHHSYDGWYPSNLRMEESWHRLFLKGACICFQSPLVQFSDEEKKHHGDYSIDYSQLRQGILLFKWVTLYI